MKEGLEHLFGLQQKDDLIKDIELLIKDIPRKIKQLEAERDAKSEMIEKAKQKLQGNIEERKSLEREIVLIKEKTGKYKEQMKKVTTNKEYQGFISEIKFEEGNIAAVEEKIIEKMVESDAIMDSIRKTESEFKQIATTYDVKIKELHDQLDDNKKKLQEEMKNRKDLRAQINSQLLKVYDNLFGKKAGKVVSLVETEFCGACNIKIRPQLLSDLVIANDLLVCENCGRILYKNLTRATDETP